MSERPRLSIVVPIYNCEPYLVEMFEGLFLDGLRRYAPPGAELVIVDDASPLEEETRRSARLAESIMPVRFHRNPSNRGFAASVNEGMRLAAGDLILLLNSDTRLTPGAVASLIGVLASAPDAAMAGPVSNRAFGADLQQVDGLAPLRDFSVPELARIDRFAEGLRAKGEGVVEATYLMGFCILLRREVFERVGPLDESFGLGYLEEVDYCLRIRDRGYRILIDRSAFVFHGGLKESRLTGANSGSQTMRTRPWSMLYHLFRNSAYLLWKRRGRLSRSQRV